MTRKSASKELREFGLAYPGAHTKSPWPGHLDLAVNDKNFAYLSPTKKATKTATKKATRKRAARRA